MKEENELKTLDDLEEKKLLIDYLNKRIRKLKEENTHKIVEINLSFNKEYLLLNMYGVKFINSILGIPLNPYANSCELVKEKDFQIIIAPIKNPNYHPYSGNVKTEHHNITEENLK